MKDFRVTWEVEVAAENAVEAARQARAIQTRRGTTATVFDTFNEDGQEERVDLLDVVEFSPVKSAALGYSTESPDWTCPACGREYNADPTLSDVQGEFLKTGRCFDDCPGAPNQSREMADRLLNRWPWLEEAEPNEDGEIEDVDISGSETIQELQNLYDALRAEEDDNPAPTTGMIDVWVTDGTGDYCPATKVFATELAAWTYVIEWLKENAEHEMAYAIGALQDADKNPTYAQAFSDALAASDFARLRTVIDELGLILDGSEYTVEKHQIPGNPPTPGFSGSELATVLHGLRLQQEQNTGPADCTAAICGHFDEAEQLTDAQIDDLCERLNLSPAAVERKVWAVAIDADDGLYAEVFATEAEAWTAVSRHKLPSDLLQRAEAMIAAGDFGSLSDWLGDDETEDTMTLFTVTGRTLTV